jgi:signal transduction histidine kinase
MHAPTDLNSPPDALTLLKALASFLGHDYRTPIAQMQGLLHLAVSDTEHREDYLPRIQFAADQVDSMAAMIRLYIRTVYTNVEFQAEEAQPANVEVLCKIAVGKYTNRTKAKNVQWDVRCQADQWELPAAKGALLVDLLVLNAVTYAKKDSTILLTCKDCTLKIGNACFAGSSSVASLPFTPFHRYHSTGTGGELGTGLGLSLAGFLAAQMGVDLVAGFESPEYFTVSLKA